MENTQEPLRLLSLDGGGIRGLSSLYILRSIMTNLASKAGQRPNQPLRPCDYFDLIAGTSTGGLIAVMLGTLRMDIQTCINEYLKMAPDIFPVEGGFSGSRAGKVLKVARGRHRFDPKPLEVAVKRLVKEHLGDDAGENKLLRNGMTNVVERHECKVFVCVTSEKLSKHFRFRSYQSPWDVVDDCPIWQACRATSAAPTFFPPIEIGQPPTSYVDGGLGYNNPIRALLDESSHIWPDRKIGCIVSIGTGVLVSPDVGRNLNPLFESLKDMATDTEKAAREFEEEMKSRYGIDQQTYFRFNVQHGLAYVGLEEWQEMDRTKVATQDYLKLQWTQIERCASQLFQPKFSIAIRTIAVTDSRFFNITKRRVGAFVVRPTLHKKLQMGFSKEPQRIDLIQDIAVVYGLGGAGKSQLVLNYVQEVRNTYTGVFWIDASDHDSVEREFRLLYRLLFRISLQEKQDLPKLDELVSLVRDRFVRRGEKFLLVFDGADNIEDAKNASFVDLNTFIPQSASVDVIITTRRSTARGFGSFSVEVREMEECEALTLLYNSSGLVRDQLAQDQQDEAERIVAELGYFALAIILAGSYISEMPLISEDLPRYLNRYREHRNHLLDQQPSPLLHQYNMSVLNACEMSFEAVSRKSSIAANLLSFLAFLDPMDIFPELFNLVDESLVADTKDRENANQWGHAICHERALTSYDIEEAFSTLRSFSIVRWMPDQKAYSMHKLVHAWGHDRLSINERRNMIWATAYLLKARILYGLGPLEKKLRFGAHLIANFNTMSRNVGRSKLAQSVYLVLSVLSSYANFLDQLGQWSSEAKIEHYIVGLCSDVFGLEHPDTCSAMNDYAAALQKQGQLDDAANMQKEVLEKLTRILGVEHPKTLSAMNNYAATLRGQGKVDEAANMSKKVWEKTTQTLSAEHPDTIKAINNYAHSLRDQGQFNEAANIQKEVCEKLSRILGVEHPSTMTAMNNYAYSLADQGELDKAANIQKEVCEKRTRLLGVEHPDTIKAINNYAHSLRDQGQLNEAANIQKEGCEKLSRILGVEHPSTMTAMNNYAHTLRDQGQLNEAANIQKEVCEKLSRSLGVEHPNTIFAMYNLACMLGLQGKVDEAANMQREVCERMTRIFGAEHPKTKNAVASLDILVNFLVSRPQPPGTEVSTRVRLICMSKQKPWPGIT